MSNIYRQAALSRNQRRQTPQSREGMGRIKHKEIQPVTYHPSQNLEELELDHQEIPKRNIFTAHSKKQETNQQHIFGNNVIHKKEPIKRFNQTAKEGFRNNIERPQSKQEPRSKAWNKSGILLKTALIEPNRPQTSKGQRPRMSFREQISHRKNSQQNDDLKVNFHGVIEKKNEEGFLISSSSSARRGMNKGRFDFKTSIDPQFLSLFAN